MPWSKNKYCVLLSHCQQFEEQFILWMRINAELPGITNLTGGSYESLLCSTLTKQTHCLGLRAGPRVCLCLRTAACVQMHVIVVMCDSLFPLLLLCILVNMYPYYSGPCVSNFVLVCKTLNTTSFILFQTQEEWPIQRQSRGSVGRGCTVGLVFCLSSVYYMGLHLSRYCQQG